MIYYAAEDDIPEKWKGNQGFIITIIYFYFLFIYLFIYLFIFIFVCLFVCCMFVCICFFSSNIYILSKNSAQGGSSSSGPSNTGTYSAPNMAQVCSLVVLDAFNCIFSFFPFLLPSFLYFRFLVWSSSCWAPSTKL